MELNECFDQGILAEIENSTYLRTHQILPVNGNIVEVHVGIAHLVDRKFKMAGIIGSQAIEITRHSQKYAFKFDEFVAFSVRDELYAESCESEKSIGGKVAIYSCSNYLDFVRKSTWATDKHPGKLLHFQLNTLDHTIDVVTSKPAILKKID